MERFHPCEIGICTCWMPEQALAWLRLGYLAFGVRRLKPSLMYLLPNMSSAHFTHKCAIESRVERRVSSVPPAIIMSEDVQADDAVHLTDDMIYCGRPVLDTAEYHA